eukprot:gene3467-3933_t
MSLRFALVATAFVAPAFASPRNVTLSWPKWTLFHSTRGDDCSVTGKGCTCNFVQAPWCRHGTPQVCKIIPPTEPPVPVNAVVPEDSLIRIPHQGYLEDEICKEVTAGVQCERDANGTLQIVVVDVYLNGEPGSAIVPKQLHGPK